MPDPTLETVELETTCPGCKRPVSSVEVRERTATIVDQGERFDVWHRACRDLREFLDCAYESSPDAVREQLADLVLKARSV